MSRVIISRSILEEPINIMTVLLREVESASNEIGQDSTSIKERILSAGSIEAIEEILREAYGNNIILVE